MNFLVKYPFSDILLKNTLTSFILLIKLLRSSEKRILTGLNPHATELICLTPVLANKIEIFIHSTTPYIHQVCSAPFTVRHFRLDCDDFSQIR